MYNSEAMDLGTTNVLGDHSSDNGGPSLKGMARLGTEVEDVSDDVKDLSSRSRDILVNIIFRWREKGFVVT